MKCLFFFFLIIVPNIIKAQNDTLYFDELRQVRTLNEATYYRLPSVKDGDKYKIEDYYISGKLKAEGHSLSSDSLIWDGLYTSYYENGNKNEVGNYINGYRVNNWKQYRENGKLWVLLSHDITSDTTEILRSFYETGKVKRIEYRVKDKDTTGVCYDEDGNKMKYTPFAQMPEFKGDIDRFLAENIHYPIGAVLHELEGRVLVNFTVLEDGRVDDVKVLNPSIDPVLMLAAVSAVKLTNGRWNPGKEDNIPVKTHFTLPVLFSLY